MAVIGGREYFAWPHDASFDQRNPVAIIGEGPISTGEFIGFARTVFTSNAATYTHRGTENRDGKTVVRYDYRVPKDRSRYPGGNERVRGDDADYISDQATRRQTSLIPAASEVVTIEPSGRETRNRMDFTDCRRYTGESKLMFGDSPPGPTGTLPDSRLEAVPPGLKLETALDTPIDISTIGAGDRITATVSRNVRSNGVDIPAGAKLIGRMLRFSVDIRALRTLLAFEFNQLQSGEQKLPFYGRLRSRGVVRGLSTIGDSKTLTATELAGVTAQWRNTARLRLKHPLTRIEPGFRMTWESTVPPGVHTK